MRPVAFALTNLSAVMILIALIASPFYFANNFTKVTDVQDTQQSRSIAGVKKVVPYILIPQADKFSNLNFYQDNDKYRIDFVKTAPQQAFLGVFTITNPTDTVKGYNLEVPEGQNKAFFGENLEEQTVFMQVPPKGSIPISVFSKDESSASSQSIEFKVEVNY
jgi:hypothetical protein